jgi:hypothetical protein
VRFDRRRERRSARHHRLSAIIGTLSGLRRNPVRNPSDSADWVPVTELSGLATQPVSTTLSDERFLASKGAIVVEIPTLKAGEILATAGKPEEALAVYHSLLASCHAKIANGTSLRAIDDLGLLPHRIGSLANPFLLASDFERAHRCASEALADLPSSVPLNLVRAHALMFLGREAEAWQSTAVIVTGRCHLRSSRAWTSSWKRFLPFAGRDSSRR